MAKNWLPCDRIAAALDDGCWHGLPELSDQLHLAPAQVSEAVAELIHRGIAYQGPEGKARDAVQLRVLADRRVLTILQMLSGDMTQPWRLVQPVAGLTLEEALETVAALEQRGVLEVDRSAADRVRFRRCEDDVDSPIGPPRGA